VRVAARRRPIHRAVESRVVTVVAVTSSQLLWYTTRAAGLVALVLLTATMLLGIATSARLDPQTQPRFAVVELHKRISILAMVFLGIHVVTTIVDPFVPIGWLTTVVPFSSPYRRFWLGLGTIAFDLLLAVLVSSALRSRMNPTTWRILHWLAYACWPVAVVHGLGTGTDRGLQWVDALVGLCVASVICAVAWRVARALRPVAPRPTGRLVAHQGGATTKQVVR
jgi:methionine sulfoxide reductase heme-binding subunit